MSTSKTTFNPLLKRGLQIVSTTAETIADVTKEPTGFEDGDNITHTYSHTDRKVTLTHPSGTLAWWWKGVRHTVASPWQSAAHTNTEGVWFLKLTGDISTATWQLNTPWQFYEVQVFAVNYRTLAVNSWGMREAHGLMPWQSHEADHYTIGTYWKSGLTLDPDTYDINGTANVQNTYAVFSGNIKDEDATTPIPAWPLGTYTIGYRSGVGGAWVFSTTETLPFIVAANTIQRNLNTSGTWSLAAVTEDNFVNYFDYCIPVSSDSDSQKYRHLIIMGQSQFTTLAAAQQEFPQNLDLGTLTDMSPEFVCVNRITYQFNASGTGAKTTTGRCAIQSVSVIRGSRASQIAASGAAPSNHSTLSGLANDDHLQYEHINGRAAQVTTSGVNFAADTNVGVYYVDTSGGNITATLPDPATYPGKMFWFINKSTNNITFAGYTIGGIANFTIDGNERLVIHSDGAAWRNVLRKPMAFWKTGITFCKDHIVEVTDGGISGTYRATTQHTAAAAWLTDIANWEQMAPVTVTTRAIAETLSANDNDMMYCVENETWYRYETAGSSFTDDNLWVLSTGAGGDHRWLGVAGKYDRSRKLSETAVIIVTGDPISLSSAVGSERSYAVVGSSTGQNAMSSTPFTFTGTPPAEPMTVWLLGRSNTSTVTLATNDAAEGALIAGDFIELGKGTAICLKYSPTLARWIEIARNNAIF